MLLGEKLAGASTMDTFANDSSSNCSRSGPVPPTVALVVAVVRLVVEVVVGVVLAMALGVALVPAALLTPTRDTLIKAVFSAAPAAVAAVTVALVVVFAAAVLT